MYSSLRSRSILGAVIVLLLMLSIALYGHFLFERATGYGQEISLEHNELSRIVNALKSPVLDLESNLYLYTLVLSDSQQQKTRLFMDEMLFQLDDLKKNNLVKKNIQLKKDVAALNTIALSIESNASTLFEMTRRDRYPALTILSDYLGPNNENFLAAFQIADYEAEELINEPAQFQIKNILNNLKYAWGQMISSTRILISARTGIFGNPDATMALVGGNLATYSRLVDELITELEKFQQQGLLGLQQASVLGEIRSVQKFRARSTQELIKILNAEVWRQDVPLILNQLKPLFEKAQAELILIERHLETLTAYNLKQTAVATRTLSNFLWLFSGFVVFIFILMYLVFEFWLRRPIVKIARAIDTVGQGRIKVKLKNTGIQEIDDLVSAFSFMQQQIASRQQRLTSILENAGESIITTDDLGLVESFNTAAEDLFGYQEKEIVGKNIKLLMPQPYQDKHDGYLKRYRDSGGSSSVMGVARELEGQRKDGTVFPLDLTTSVIFVGEQRKFIGVIQDMTAHKHDEMKLKKAKEKAELAHAIITRKNQEIQLSIDQLKETQSQLVEAEKMASLGELVAGVAHEINTPIGIGVTATSHMIEELKLMKVLLDKGELTQTNLEQFYEEAIDASTILMNNLNRAADLVRSFKQVAVDQSSEEKRLFNVAEYVREILLNLRPQLKKTRHIIQIDCAQDLSIQSMPGAISQILTNLIMNSLIHAFDENEQGKIIIKFVVESGKLCWNYSDNGKGMSPEIVKQIFNPFFTTRRKDGGSGLGLHIVYNLVTQTLHGKVGCDSKPGSGTDFNIEIPLD